MTAVLDDAADASENRAAPGGHMPRFALVVDDSAVDRRLAGSIVEKTTDLRVLYAADGKAALAVLEKETPVLVLTDLQMPNMNGLELVEAIRTDYPAIPVVLMTANGSEEIAVAALRLGAAGYIAKRQLHADLPPILTQMLVVTRADRRKNDLLGCITHLDCRFVLDNDPALVPLLVAHLQEQAERLRLVDKNSKIRLGVALAEALLNGIYHGNLDVSSELKYDGSDAFERLAEERRSQAPYAARRLHVHAQMDADKATFVVRDEGFGFDYSKLPDPTDPENLLKPSGRGLLLIRTFMDEAIHNSAGNELTLIKRRRPAST